MGACIFWPPPPKQKTKILENPIGMQKFFNFLQKIFKNVSLVPPLKKISRVPPIFYHSSPMIICAYELVARHVLNRVMNQVVYRIRGSRGFNSSRIAKPKQGRSQNLFTGGGGPNGSQGWPSQLYNSFDVQSIKQKYFYNFVKNQYKLTQQHLNKIILL